MKEKSSSVEDDSKDFNDLPPALGVPQNEIHSKCIEEILSLENLFPAPPAKKDEFEVIKMHNGDINHNYARIFFEFNEGANVEYSKQALENVKNDCREINDENILKNVKKIVVDRSKIKGYSQGKANDEIVFDDKYNILTAVGFYNKPKGDKIEKGGGLRGNTVYNKVMVVKYDNKYLGPQAFIVDMDNNLIITSDDLKLYCHSKDNGTGFDDKETPVYISSSIVVPMYHRFRINNAIKFGNDAEEYWFYQNAIKQLNKHRYDYGINYNIYSKEGEIIMEGNRPAHEVAPEWATNVSTFVTSQVQEFKEIIQEQLDIEVKKQKIQTFCNSFKDYLLGHKKNNDGADKKDNKKYDNIIMVSDEDYNSVDALLSFYKDNIKEEELQKQVENIIYPVFKQITDFIKQIKQEAKKIENPNAQSFSTDDNQSPTTFEKLMKCEGCCEFGLPDCLNNCLEKKG